MPQETTSIVVGSRNLQRSILDERAEDFVVRMCLAGEGRWSTMHRAAIECGHVSPENPRSGWLFGTIINRCLAAGKIERAYRGFYVAKCPHCGEAILNVMGAEH